MGHDAGLETGGPLSAVRSLVCDYLTDDARDPAAGGRFGTPSSGVDRTKGHSLYSQGARDPRWEEETSEGRSPDHLQTEETGHGNLHHTSSPLIPSGVQDPRGVRDAPFPSTEGEIGRHHRPRCLG